MRAYVIGGTGFIGSSLVSALRGARIEADYTVRPAFDLLNVPGRIPSDEFLPEYDIIYICAATTRFIDCEDNPTAYRINVDAPIAIAIAAHPAKIVYLSSEAVERALHTNYGMHKALAEIGLRAVCDPVIARLSKVTEETLDECCAFLVSLSKAEPGVYRWP